MRVKNIYGKIIFDSVKENLKYINLRNAVLENANLKGVNLVNANLENANLENANLENANLENAKGLSVNNLLNKTSKVSFWALMAHILIGGAVIGLSVYTIYNTLGIIIWLMILSIK